MQNGQGYLYANSNTVTLSFAGVMHPNTVTSIEVPLTFSEGKTYAGWNLVGNPFDGSATLGNTNFYRINGNELDASSGEIGVCEGVFVQATANNQSVTFQRTATQGEPEPSDGLSLGLYNNTSRRLDLARIRFNEGDNLGKLDLFSDPNKLYIPLDGKEYAVVHTGAVGELPLSFKAAENGRYTLAANLEEVEMSYLHLVDNLTGADVNMLETPSYSFDARTTDYATRFKVVFAQGSSTDGNSFAFVRDGHLVVFGQEGQSVLQVIDMMGRIFSSESFNGSYEKKLDVAPGVYMIRLINGDTVKTQKIVVK